MKLLIITQRLDVKDPILGFFHQWIVELASHCERVTVIAQMTGEYTMPSNVTVYSLHKERGVSTYLQIIRFWKLLLSNRKSYDTVFVHMIPWWVVLGGPIWKILSKPVCLWYEHQKASTILRIAIMFVQKTFSASLNGMPIKTSKTNILGHGIAVHGYNLPVSQRDENLLLTIGRISRSKHLLEIIDAFSQQDSMYVLRIAGVALTEDDKKYAAEIQKKISALQLESRVRVQPAAKEEVITLLQSATLFMHASNTGLDKAILEAMSCGCLVVSCSSVVKPSLPRWAQATSDTLAIVTRSILGLPKEEKQKKGIQLRTIIQEEHALDVLIVRLLREMQSQ